MNTVRVNGIKRVLNLKPSRAVERDWGYAGRGLPVFEKPIQDEISWRPKNWMPFDQGRTGTCVGNGISGAIYCQTGIILSRLQIWLNAVINDEWKETVPGALGNGTSIKAGLDYMRKTGAVPERQWPFYPYKSWYEGDGSELLQESGKYQIESFYTLGKDQEVWKLWLSNYGPVVKGIDVDISYQIPKENGVLREYRPETVSGKHCIFCDGWSKNTGRYSWPGSYGGEFGDGGIVYPDEEHASQSVFEAYGMIIKWHK